jgi:hypothetical protein
VEALHPAITAVDEEWGCELYAIHEASAGLALCEVGALIAFLMSEVAGFMTAGTCGRS